MTVYYQEFHQVMTPVAAAVPDVVCLLKQINTSGAWYTAINLTFTD